MPWQINRKIIEEFSEDDMMIELKNQVEACERSAQELDAQLGSDHSPETGGQLERGRGRALAEAMDELRYRAYSICG